VSRMNANGRCKTFATIGYSRTEMYYESYFLQTSPEWLVAFS
jgi:hypothetical protein